MTAQSPHGLSCNGCDVANDDIAELEKMQKIENITHDIFKNAARIHAAMRTNRLLVDVFRKYKHTCREILQEKHLVLNHLVSLCDYCDAFQDNPHQTKHNMKCIQSEINDMRNETTALEELRWSDDDSDSDDSESESESESEDPLEKDEAIVYSSDSSSDSDSEDSEDSEDSDSSSDSDAVMDMSTF